MVIVIPSKNIYGDIENTKITNNDINSVAIESQKVSQEINENTVFEEKISNVGNKIELNSSKIGRSNNTDSIPLIYITHLHCKSYHKLSQTDLRIPRKVRFGFIKNLVLSKDAISVRFFGKIEKGKATETVQVTDSSVQLGEISYTPIPQDEERDVEIFLPQNISLEVNGEYINLPLPTENNFDSISYSIDDKSDEFVIDEINFVSSLGYISSLTGTGRILNTENATTVYLEGDYTNYIVERIEIAINGIVVSLSLSDKTLTYGTSTKQYLIEGNELMQDNALTYGIATTKFLADNIISEYLNGKEIATLICSFDDYYDVDGNKVISINDKTIDVPYSRSDEQITSLLNVAIITIDPNPNEEVFIVYRLTDSEGGTYEGTANFSPSDTELRISYNKYQVLTINSVYKIPSMTLRENQKVIPMVLDANGKDRPMSRYKEGSAKEFKIIGTRIFYDGSVMQKIYLQEI